MIIAEFRFPLAFASKRKKLDGFAGLPKFRWEDLVGQEVIGQGTFGVVFLTEFQADGKPAENLIVKKLLSTAQDFAATFTKEAKILKDLQHKNIVSLRPHVSI